jgi:hypothetical protein
MVSPIFAAIHEPGPTFSDYIKALPLPSAKILAKSCFGFYWVFVDIRNFPIRLIYSYSYANLHSCIDVLSAFLEMKGYSRFYKKPSEFKILGKVIAVSVHFFFIATLSNVLLQSKYSIAMFSGQQTKLWRVLVFDMVVEGGAYGIQELWNWWQRLWTSKT